MSKFFIERPIFAIVMAIVISIAGVLCMFTLPVDRYPHITPPQVSVHATYYGADSQVVNDTVAEVIEKQVVSVEGFDNMSSTSNSNGSYSLNVQFKSGVDDDMATVRVQNAVSQATAGLPDSVKTLGVTTQKSSGDMALVISLQSPNNTYDAAFLKNYFSINYLDELKTIPGVGNITEWGSDYAMRVWLDPMKMTKNNITTSEIVNAIATQNQQIAGGIIGTAPVAQGTALQYIVNAEGRLKTPEQFGEIVLRTNADGSLLKLKDVSRIVLDQRSYDFIARSGNHASSALGISLTSDANAVQTLTQIKEKLAQDAKSFPEDMTYAINMDNTDFINASINEVMHTFFEALVLVAIIVYIFLQNWRSTLIPMIAVPVSLLGTIASFEVLGFTINTLSLVAMVLAIGLVVDDAIVVIEAVEYEMRYNGKSPKEATYIAMQKVQSPVIGVACVLAAVFVPVSFLGGIMGILYKQFALTIAISVILSAFVALSLTPTLCASILKEESKVIERGRLQKFWDKFNDGFDRMVKIYGNFLRRLAKRLVVPMGVLVALTVISGVLFVKLPPAFLPSEDNGYFFASFTLPEGSVNVRTNQEVEKFLSFIAKQPGVQEEMGITGSDILSGGQKSNAATSFVKLKPWNERKTPDTSVDAMVGKAFAFGAMNPGANIIAMNPPPIPGLGTSSGFTLYILDKSGGSMEELNNVTNQFLAAANQRPEINGAYTTFRMDTPAYHYDVDRLKAEKNGVNIGDIFSTLATFYGGNTVNDFTLFGRNYKVVVEGDTPFRMNLADNKYVTVREALTALQEVADQVLPSGYSYAFADTSEQELEAGNKTVYALSLGILFVFLSLAALYESWKIPFSILFGLPTGFFGAVVAAFAFNVYNDIYFQIGLLTIIGLAAKNAILIVEYAKVRVDNGMDVVQSAIEAAEIRLRPILMTSLAFILGNIPLALSTGAGSVSRSEMGIAVVFGVTSATIFQIFIIPMLFIVLERINFSGLRKKILKR